MDPRLNIEINDLSRREAERTARHRWPDDGLPPHFERTRHTAALHPAAVFASLLTWRR